MRISYNVKCYIIVYTYPRFLTQNEALNVVLIYSYTTGTVSGAYTEQTYSYGNTSWGDQLTAVGGTSITYDAIGNPTSIGGTSLTWQGRRLMSYGSNTYTYNAEGIRTSKTVNGVTHTYTLEGSTILAENYTGVSLRFLYDNTGVIGVYYNGTLYMYEKNLQGDVVALISPSLERVVEYTYDAWGNVISTTGSLASTVGAANPIRYRSYYYDTETGWYYLQSRYYNPSWGRFMNADAYISTGTGFIGYNMYAYCNNNPVSASDSSGNWPRWITAKVAVVAAVVAVTAIATGNVVVAAASTRTAITATAVLAVQTIHYDVREILNTNLPESPEIADELNWRNSNEYDEKTNPNGGGPAADCHNYTSSDNSNVKYVSPGNGKKEIIFNKYSTEVTDSRDKGTYNFCPSGKWYQDVGHFFFDMLPWILFGNDDNDWGPAINWIYEVGDMS